MLGSWSAGNNQGKPQQLSCLHIVVYSVSKLILCRVLSWVCEYITVRTAPTQIAIHLSHMNALLRGKAGILYCFSHPHVIIHSSGSCDDFSKKKTFDESHTYAMR